ncbi:MAG: putative peptidoglycan glycosyltransferase FtsW [Rhodospirillales bacterium]|nr:putative peptidoglycan glycosyltransferase FtsW [Rhodospirillales bacterium]
MTSGAEAMRGWFVRWAGSVDRINLALLMGLACVGVLAVMTATHLVAIHRGFDELYFFGWHVRVLVPTLAVMVALSFLSPLGVFRLSVGGLAIVMVLMVLTLATAEPVNGARRWLNVGGLSLQASELAKPFFAVVTGWLLARGRNTSFGVLVRSRPSYLLMPLGLLFALWALLVAQPDFGMTMIVGIAWCGQLFLAGLRLRLMLLAALVGAGLVGIAYKTLSHVEDRINQFLYPDGEAGYQVGKGLEAYGRGGFLGQGPGEGTIKASIPDAHTDFIFPVIAEEFGVAACFAVLALVAGITFRGLSRLRGSQDLFVMLAAGGLLLQFVLQALVHVAVTLNLAPTTGVTMPFISTGGSSLLAVGIAMGLMLALTRRRVVPAGWNR